VGFFGFIPGYRLFFLWFSFATLFQYFWIMPDEMFKDTIKKCAAIAFLVSTASFMVFLPLSFVLGVESPAQFAVWLS